MSPSPQSDHRPFLSAFGSSRIAEDDPRFTDAQALSQHLGTAGWNGLTGGHQGMMAAFSRGLTAAGGQVHGVTLEQFPTPPGNTLTEEIRSRDFFTRMQHLIEHADAYLVLPGGLGTLAELAMTWDLLAIHTLQPRPLVVYGKCWLPVLDQLKASLVISVDHSMDVITYCETHDQVLEALSLPLQS